MKNKNYQPTNERERDLLCPLTFFPVVEILQNIIYVTDSKYHLIQVRQL